MFGSVHNDVLFVKKKTNAAYNLPFKIDLIIVVSRSPPILEKELF